MRAAALAAAVVAAAAVAGLQPAAAGAAGAAEEARAARVLVLSAPGLRWEDVSPRRTPALAALFGRSAVASLSVRTIGPRTTLGEGYATIGAGNRATVLDADAGLALEPAAPFEAGTAAEAFTRRTGAPARGAALVLPVASVEALNESLLYDAEVGALADALATGGRRAAVIANGDTSRRSALSTFRREAALAVMDGKGRVAAGDVTRRLLLDDPSAPFGLRLDPDAVERAFVAAWADAPLVLVELSDLARAQAHAPLATPGAARTAGTRALAWSDELAERLLAHVDPRRDAVIAVSPVAPVGGHEQLTVAALAAPGVRPGRAVSATTRRAGFVTLADVAPTALDLLGLPRPPAMTGSPITSAGGPRAGPDAFARLAETNDRTVFRDRATGPTTVVFVVFQILCYGLAVLALLRRRARLGAVVAFMALVTLATPTVLFLAALVPFPALGLVGFVVAALAAGAGLAALAAVLARDQAVAAVSLVALLLAVLVADIVTGGRLQLNTVLGYSPVVAGRFAGYGNLAFGLVAVSAIVVATDAWGRATGGAGRSRRALAAVVAVFLVVLVVDGHPRLGSDVGGVLALVPAFAVAVLGLSGARLSWRRGVAIAAGAAAALALFTAVDLNNPPDSRTHLGRLATRVLGGDGGLDTVLVRKARANVGILTSSVWTYVIPVAIAFLAFLAWRPPNVVRELTARHRGLRACLTAGLVAGVLGCLLNDSGVAVPAVMLAVALPYVTVLSMQLPQAAPRADPRPLRARSHPAAPASRNPSWRRRSS